MDTLLPQKTMTSSATKATQFTLPLLLFICLGHFFVDFMLGIWPVFKTMAGLDLALSGFLAAGCVVMGEGLQGYFGNLCDRGYQSILLLVGISVATAACFLSYSDSYVGFFLLFMCTCLGSSAFHPTAASILSNLQANNRSSIMGLFTAAGMIGLGVSQLLFSWTYLNNEGATAILALPSIVLALASYFFFKDRSHKSKTSEKEHSFSLYMKFLRVKELRALYLSMLGNQIILWSLVFLLPDFLLERGYSTWVVFGGGNFFLMAGATIGPPIFGYLADRVSTRQVIVSTSLLTLASFYALLVPYVLSEELLFALLFLLGTMLGSVPPLIWALGGQMVPQHRGVISAFLMGFVWIFSESLGLGFSGYLATLFVENPATNALALMGTVQIVSCFANSQLPKSVREVVIA